MWFWLGVGGTFPPSVRRTGRAASGACDRKAPERPRGGATWAFRQRGERACQASRGRWKCATDPQSYGVPRGRVPHPDRPTRFGRFRYGAGATPPSARTPSAGAQPPARPATRSAHPPPDHSHSERVRTQRIRISGFPGQNSKFQKFSPARKPAPCTGRLGGRPISARPKFATPSRILSQIGRAAVNRVWIPWPGSERDPCSGAYSGVENDQIQPRTHGEIRHSIRACGGGDGHS